MKSLLKNNSHRMLTTATLLCINVLVAMETPHKITIENQLPQPIFVGPQMGFYNDCTKIGCQQKVELLITPHRKIAYVTIVLPSHNPSPMNLEIKNKVEHLIISPQPSILIRNRMGHTIATAPAIQKKSSL